MLYKQDWLIKMLNLFFSVFVKQFGSSVWIQKYKNSHTHYTPNASINVLWEKQL